MQKFEYTLESISDPDNDSTVHADFEQIKKDGQEGWETSLAFTGKDGKLWIMLKRPKG